MGRKSTIRLLPPEIRKELDRLLADDRLTQAQIVEHMRGLGASVSESAVYRYNVQFQELARDLRLTREMAAVVGRELEASTEHSTGRMVVASLEDLLFKAQLQLRSGGDIDERRVNQLASAARNLSVAWKAHADTEIKIRERLHRAAKAAEKTGRKLGWSASTVEMVKASILGIQPKEAEVT